ncbi:MAG: DUF547 domain-containing protein [Verrucomicrobiota bacterium]
MKIWMLIGLLFTLAGPDGVNAITDDYALLLKKYVSADGVDYQGWKDHPNDLARLGQAAETVAQPLPANTDRSTRLAYYINAYNIWTLVKVLEDYPIESVKSVRPFFGFFKDKDITVDGKVTSLDALEKEILLPQFKDPRIHFAINCASRSCPPLISEPFAANRLEEQLEAVTRHFISENPYAYEQKDGALYLSSLFDWYRADFEKKGAVFPFINRYRSVPIPADAQVRYLPYDWSLNQAPR